jgi:hypothetical protein
MPIVKLTAKEKKAGVDLRDVLGPRTAPKGDGSPVISDATTRASRRFTNVSFDVSLPVAKALRALRDTGFFGTGDCASVAEELLRRALMEPDIAAVWRKP